MGVLGSRSFGTRSLAAVGLVATLVMSLLVAPRAAAQVADGGFESGVLGGPDAPPMDPSFGMWTRRDTNSRLAMAPEPVHSGVWSAAVDTRTSQIGSFVIQDFPSGNASYRFTFWIYPVEGINGVSIVYNWDRGVTGFSERGTGLGFTPSATGFVGWNSPPASFPPLTPDAWHEIHVVANRCTLVQELSVDGAVLGSVQANGTAPSGNATISFGDGAFAANHGFFFYDDFSFTPFDCTECDDDDEDDEDDEDRDDDEGDDDDDDEEGNRTRSEAGLGAERGIRPIGADDDDDDDDDEDEADDDDDDEGDDDEDDEDDEDDPCLDMDDEDLGGGNPGEGDEDAAEDLQLPESYGTEGTNGKRPRGDGAGSPDVGLSVMIGLALGGLAGPAAAILAGRRLFSQR